MVQRDAGGTPSLGRAGARRARRRVAIVAAAAVLVAGGVVGGVLASRSSSPKATTSFHATTPTPAPSGLLAKALTATTASGAEFSFVLHDDLGATPRVDVSGTGSCSWRPRACSFGELLSGSALRTVAAFSPGSERLVGSTIYARLPGTYASILGKQWISLDLGTILPYLHFTAADQAVLAGLPEALGGLVGTAGVDEFGTGAVDGTAVTYYELSTGLDPLRSELEALFPELWPPSSHPALRLTFALDGSARLRELTETMTAATAGIVEHERLSVTVTAFASVSIGAPAAAQTVPLTELLKLEASA